MVNNHLQKKFRVKLDQDWLNISYLELQQTLEFIDNDINITIANQNLY